MNDYRDDDALFSIGTAGVASPRDEHDTASDRSDWVKQYNAWQDTSDRFSRAAPAPPLFPNHLAGFKDRTVRAAEPVAPAC